MKKFSAGAVKYPFWFSEFVSVLEWVLDGASDSEVKQKVMNENYFQLTSASRRQNVAGCVLRRVHALPTELQSIFFSLDSDNQRVAVLIGIMKSDPLIEAFMMDCYKDAVVFGDDMLEDDELNGFFAGLQAQRDDVAAWQDVTITRLKGTIRNYLRAAGIASGEGDQLRCRKPLLDSRLVSILNDSGDQAYVVSLTGTNYG